MVQSLFMLYSIHLPISLELAPLFKSITFLFLGYVALECCARLPGGALGTKECSMSFAGPMFGVVALHLFRVLQNWSVTI